ncbi:hypothetical protein H2248_004122 [Termitomyces sp. 'cryptogamus']|nr:hypothetical protein H2248_004122 [Termitomyces sp. 'cryptogamus']
MLKFFWLASTFSVLFFEFAVNFSDARDLHIDHNHDRRVIITSASSTMATTMRLTNTATSTLKLDHRHNAEPHHHQPHTHHNDNSTTLTLPPTTLLSTTIVSTTP